MLEKIFSYQNIQAAYFEVVEQFSADRRLRRYHGADNLYLIDFEHSSHELINKIKEELQNKLPLEPALAVDIPKKNRPDELRRIFVYNFKERIKAQAVYRVLLPEFEKKFSPRLFSYRPGRAPHQAARLYAHRYRHKFSSSYSLIFDIHEYGDNIDRNILIKKLQHIFPDQTVVDILKLFIFVDFYQDGALLCPQKGLIIGNPLTVLFANLYLTDFDFKYHQRVDFYVRVGDDVVISDDDFLKIKKTFEDIKKDLADLSISFNETKVFSGPTNDPHHYLGYVFCRGLVSLPSNQINRLLNSWRKILRYKHLPSSKKDALFKRFVFNPRSGALSQFVRVIGEKTQLNDSRQIQYLSEEFFKIITRFFYIKYTPRHRRLLSEKLLAYHFDSLYSIYKKFHYGRS